jgi:hypothetical protein
MVKKSLASKPLGLDFGPARLLVTAAVILLQSVGLKQLAQGENSVVAAAEVSPKNGAAVTREALVGRWKSVEEGPLGNFIHIEFRENTFNNGPLGEFIGYSVTEIKGARIRIAWEQETVLRNFRRTSGIEFLPSGNMLLSWSNIGDPIEFSRVSEARESDEVRDSVPEAKRNPGGQNPVVRMVKAEDLDALSIQAAKGKLLLNNFNFVIEKAIFGGAKASVQCSVKNKSGREANYSVYVAALDKSGAVVVCFCLEPTLNVHEAGKVETLETSGLVESEDRERIASFSIRVVNQRRGE